LTGDILSGNGIAVLWAEAAIIIFYHRPTSRTTGQRIFMFVVAETNKQTKPKDTRQRWSLSEAETIWAFPVQTVTMLLSKQRKPELELTEQIPSKLASQTSEQAEKIRPFFSAKSIRTSPVKKIRNCAVRVNVKLELFLSKWRAIGMLLLGLKPIEVICSVRIKLVRTIPLIKQRYWAELFLKKNTIKTARAKRQFEPFMPEQKPAELFCQKRYSQSKSPSQL
jgi:hypothetical protein